MHATHGKLTGKVAAITGGNRGIGLATAQLFRAEGARVAIFGRDEATPEHAALLGADALGFAGDVTSIHDVKAFFQAVEQRFGHLDVLFVNAGVSKSAPIADVTEDFFDELFDINVKGAFFTVQQALPLLGSPASIVINTSMVNQVGYPALSVYSATKAALRALVRSFAAELVERGIRVNAVSPGPIATTLLTRDIPDAATRDAILTGIASAIPMKRMGTPAEIARAVLYLASDDASFTTAEELVVDGGMSQF
ncbi:SDR family oxidoreductase [Chondromyces crocatus]|uniref:Short-chain dehydrogenase n=1 Tax=Chondromyces crocatus TaxID=52 RepID=A0A0K1EJZ5_CHOCO|nr:SDR family oxidoreductase [Chondromyces crocatus]AKT41180.1 short-chain dehydrogenase [Chondromyces crocatus]